MKTFVSIFLLLSVFGIASLTQSCNTKNNSKPSMQTDSIYDIDSNVYKTVKIGNQWWMAENLKVTHYQNGNTILGIEKNDENNYLWDTLVIGAYCAYLYTSSDGGMNGLLYNWYAVNDSRSIAPKGWHVATEQDWKELETTLGMKSTDADKNGWRGTTEGDKLKAEGEEVWRKSDNIFTIWGNNESGFSALAGSCRMFRKINGSSWGYPGVKSNGFWWTANLNEDSTNYANYRNLDYNKSSIFRYYGQKSYGFSVRCVKDK